MTRRLGCVAAVALLGACGGGGAATGSVCPSAGSSLTYANFGQGFMTRYCIQCHGASRTESGIRLDSQSGVRAHLTDIDVEAAAGPSAANTDMPDGDPKPTTAERQQLGEWLACGAP